MYVCIRSIEVLLRNQAPEYKKNFLFEIQTITFTADLWAKSVLPPSLIIAIIKSRIYSDFMTFEMYMFIFKYGN